MYETASPTVLRFCTSSSGIFTPNFSSAATTTSTIDSESTSRSSVKDFSSATSSGLTPATSSRISARPLVMSSRLVMCGFLSETGCCVLRAADDLPGVRETTAEAEQQYGRAGGYLATLDHLGQRERHAGRRGVTGADDVSGDDRVGQVEPLDDAVDDAHVRLVSDERADLLGRDAGALAHLQRQRRERRRRPAEDGLAVLADVRPPALDLEHVALLRG